MSPSIRGHPQIRRHDQDSVSVLRMKADGDAVMRKMDKLYLHNPSMMYTLAGGDPNSGNAAR